VSDHPQAAAVRASSTHVVGSALRRSPDRRNLWQHHPRQRVLSRLHIHRKYLVVGAVDPHQQVVLSPRRFGFEAFSAWATTHLTPSDALVLEATSNAWLLYDQLQPLVGSVTVAHPLAVKLIAAARVKTDSRDTIKLAHLLEALLVPAVWVPPMHVRELRALVNLSLRLVNQRTQVRNRLRAVLHSHNLTPPGQPFSAHQQQWWLSLDLSSSEKLRVQQDLSLLRSLEELVGAVEVELGRLSTCDPWIKQVPFLVQLPGLGVLSVMSPPSGHRRYHALPLCQKAGRLCRARSKRS
jgi:transposase